jgi:hypothetical protein
MVIMTSSLLAQKIEKEGPKVLTKFEQEFQTEKLRV